MSHLTDEQLELEVLPTEASAHLGACPACRGKVRDAAARRRLLRGLTPYTLSEMGFRRVEARLMEEVQHGRWPATSAWRHAWWVAPVALGALVLAFMLNRPAARPTVFAAAPTAWPAGRVEPLTVLRGSTDARVRHAMLAWHPLAAGDVVAADDAIFGSSVQLAPATGTAWAFEVAGAASVGGSSTLSLGAGSLKARISGAEADVAVGGLHLLSTEAVFALNRSAAELVVDVASGSVEVVESSSSARRTVTAPARLRLADGSPIASAQVLPLEPVELAPTPPRPWVRFETSTLPAGTVVSLDGALLGEAPFVLLLGQGRHRLGLAPPGKPSRESWVELTGEHFLPTLTAEPLAPEAPPPDDAAIARVQDELVRNRPKLAACYEKWLKANPAATANVELLLVVDPTGRVKAASVKGASMSKPSAECLVQTAKRLVLPGLGSEVELALPLHLTTHTP
jgi:hypothetical protein